MSGLQESKGIHHSLGQDDDSYIVLLMSFFKDGNPLMFIKRERAGANQAKWLDECPNEIIQPKHTALPARPINLLS
jgi:hypothetical protein